MSWVIVGVQVANSTGGTLRRANVRITGGRITRIGVDGEMVWEAGMATGTRPGRVLRRQD